MLASKTWTQTDAGPEVKAYQIGAGPFAVRAFPVTSLDDVAAYVGACPPNAFVIRGTPVAEVIPYRRHRAQGGEAPTIAAAAHRWLAIDFDDKAGEPRVDLPAMAVEARASLPPAFHGARAFALATSSCGVLPGIRVRLWFWLTREISDSEAKAWLAGSPVDASIYNPSVPCYCAPPTFTELPDPFAETSRHAWLDGAPEVQVPETFDTPSDPLAGFGKAAAGAVVGNRNAHLTSLAGSMRRRAMSEAAIAAGLKAENAALPDPLPESEVEGIARSIARYEPEPEAIAHVPLRGAWSEHAIVNDEGGIIPCAENYSLLLRHHEAFGLWLNSRTGKPVWDRCPWRAPATPVADGDDFQMLCWLARERIWYKPPCDLLQGIAEVAAARPYDPWRGFLEGLTWDGTPRLGTAAARLLGDRTPAAGQMFAWWLISSVARSYVPGTQVDHMLILEGLTGLGKTTFLRELVIDPAFYARLVVHGDLSNVRTIGKIHGPVVIELAELETLRRAGVQAMKAFVDERIDRVQWLYARTQTDVPRSCVFAGTTNDPTFLEDETGNRRYWPIACKSVDIPQLKLEREQLWAEAVALYKAGTKWWPTAEDSGLELEQIQEDRRKIPVAEETISGLVDATYAAGMHVLTGTQLTAEQLVNGKLQWVTTGQLCTLARCKDYEAQAAMKAIKWMPQRVRLLTGTRIRAYVRPEVAQ